MSAPPTIPPRPSRAQNSTPGSAHMDVPKIPPRPKRGVDRSVSPNREAFARSPLNDPSFLHNGQPHKDSNLVLSVSLPSLGEEGSEYASFEDLSKTLTNQSQAPEQTKQVAGDLPLYAPTASLPNSTAKSRIQTVTRTDSEQAAAAGFGKLAPEAKPSGDSSRSVSSRPSSIYKDEVDEHGIPEIGVQVPMYPNAGDVQAPTPSPYDQGVSTGIGFFNKGDKPRHHSRTKSGREIFHGPPGSYGLHGHGKIGNTEFEQKWYAKHPEDLKREKAGEYGPHIQENRKDYHWGTDKLDKLVRTAGAQGIGMGTSREAVSTPDEQIGYMATEEYASRMASPRPQSSGRPASISDKTAPVVESPLRQANFPADALTKQKTNESEVGEDVIHIDHPSRRTSKIGGGGYDPPTHDLGRRGGNTDEEGGWVSERGYGTPILASDEIKKNANAEWRQPAISPELERRGSAEYTINEDGTPAYITKQRTHSRTHSRSSSRNSNSANAGRHIQSPPQFDRGGTPLDSMKEYEPLFPEDDDATKKAKSPVDKIKKRPDLARHHFPSQDVWEDSPSSHHLETTVDAPQAPDEPKTAEHEADAADVFEKPQAEQERKETITKEDQQSFLSEHTKKFANKHLDKVSGSGRPGIQHRFPSQDIWEDTPDHFKLETTVSAPQTPETNEYADDSPVADKPSIPARPNIPARPQNTKEVSPVDKKAPVLPGRPKPQVPVRPSKPSTASSEKVPTVGSDEGAGAESKPKAKPPVPARPGGSKIAALQAGFLKDLNSKLGLGPPKVKEPEPEKEEEPAKPLQDARKGRAKGPQRRKPTASPAPAATVTAEVAVPRQALSLGIVGTLWQIGDSGEVDVPTAELSAKLHDALKPSAPAAEETAAAPSAEEPKASEDVLEKDEHVEPGEADLAPTTIKDAEPVPAAVEANDEVSDEPVKDETAGKSEPITADPEDAEPVIENKLPGGGVSLEQTESLEAEIQKETKEALAQGKGEEVPNDAAAA
ncbi:hypothetical protein N0V90_000494 [Kalmusia sp. IMI 367209]|nr:hypothetical protein N0V90_000494 [Kalmusia sp. IMI 367209]